MSRVIASEFCWLSYNVICKLSVFFCFFFYFIPEVFETGF